MKRGATRSAVSGIGELSGPALAAFRDELEAQKRDLAAPDFWYPYDTYGNFVLLDHLLSGEHREIATLAGGRRVADIGGADGDLAFYLESQGYEVDLVENGATNYNGLRGARLVKKARRSKVRIEEVDLDSQFRLPHRSYGLVFLLGILYHLQNPYYVLQQLARSSRHCLLSTRVARYTTDQRVHLAEAPVAYLVAPTETNDDPTNYWIFSEAGLRRILDRTGWDVLASRSYGDTTSSDPASSDHDERMFCLLRSRAA